MLCRRRKDRSFPNVSGRSSGASGSSSWNDAPVKWSEASIDFRLVGEVGKQEEASGLNFIRIWMYRWNPRYIAHSSDASRGPLVELRGREAAQAISKGRFGRLIRNEVALTPRGIPVMFF